jgi:hypothetical protein
MRFRARGVVLTAPAVVLLAFAPGAAAGPLTLHGSGPITRLTCASSPCVATLRRSGGRPVVTLTRLHASIRGGTRQDVYELSWKVGNSHLRLDAEALRPLSPVGAIALAPISSWARTAPSGLVGALNGDFFGYRGWSGGFPSGMLVRSRTIDAFGWGGPGVGYTTRALGGQDGGMVFGTPRAVPDTITLPGGEVATIGAFVSTPDGLGPQLDKLPGDQVAVVTAHNQEFKVPSKAVAVVLGSSATPNPFPTMLRGSRPGYRNPTNTSTSAKETVVAFRFGERGVATRTLTLPISQTACPGGVCPAGTRITLHSGQALLVARANRFAGDGLVAAAERTATLRVAVDPAKWAHVGDVMGGKPLLVKNGVARYTTPWADPPMMDHNPCYQWCGRFWRPALMMGTNGWGSMLIAGAPSSGIYGWQWTGMLRQLGAQDAIGFDNNSSTELLVPGRSPATGWTFDSSDHWERDIPEATALSFK